MRAEIRSIVDALGCRVSEPILTLSNATGTPLVEADDAPGQRVV
jgi:hypothetical protein